MSRSRRANAVIAAAVLVMATLASGVAEAGLHLRFGPLGIARFAVGRVLGLGGLRHGRFAARHARIRTAALGPPDLRAVEAVRPSLRAQLTAAAALSGWHGGRSREGWWRHGDGGYGWVGPLFWPYASDDLADYILFGDGAGLFAYGYADIYAAIFAPYAPNDLVAYVEPGRRHRRVPHVQELCGDASDMAGLPLERIEQVVRPNELQRTALDQLATAWIAGRETIRASCPAVLPSFGLDRLALMQHRLEAMLEAVANVSPQLAKFYDGLDDEQKARLNALQPDRGRPIAAGARKDTPATCDREPSAALPWQTDEIAANLHLNDVQSAALDVVQDTTLRTIATLNAACQRQAALTPSARLAAVKARLNAMLQATRDVSDALDDFYFNLSDQQKAQFEAIGPRRGA